MNTARLQHLIPAGIILALSLIVAWLSFTQEPAESFLFPRVISVAFVGLGIWNFIRAASGLAKIGAGFDVETIKNVGPGLAVLLIYVFFLAKVLGFYLASTICFFAVYSFYDPASLTSTKDWLKRVVVTIAFMAVIYALFALVLQVQTPRGLFF